MKQEINILVSTNPIIFFHCEHIFQTSKMILMYSTWTVGDELYRNQMDYIIVTRR